MMVWGRAADFFQEGLPERLSGRLGLPLAVVRMVELDFLRLPVHREGVNVVEQVAKSAISLCVLPVSLGVSLKIREKDARDVLIPLSDTL